MEKEVVLENNGNVKIEVYSGEETSTVKKSNK